jgi:hypothetical protein
MFWQNICKFVCAKLKNMKKNILSIAAIIMIGSITSFSQGISKSLDNVQKEVNKLTKPKKKPLTNDEVINGLKEALNVGTNNSTGSASKVDGFYKNPLILIPFPAEAEKVKNTVVKLGMQKQVDEFVITLNRAAEEASKEAAPVFLDAIKSMSISDGFSILKGSDSAATKYLQDKTTSDLTLKIAPIIKRAIDKVSVTKYWNPLITTYNKAPGVEKQNPDLEKYVTTKAMQGLFKLLATEEKKIRTDPLAQVTDLLKKVFGK